MDELIHLETDNGTWLGYREQQQGDSVQALLPEMIRKTLQSLPVPKTCAGAHHALSSRARCTGWSPCMAAMSLLLKHWV